MIFGIALAFLGLTLKVLNTNFEVWVKNLFLIWVKFCDILFLVTLYIFDTFLSGAEIIAVLEIDELEFFFLVEILFSRVLLVVSSVLLECSLEPVN